MALLTAANLALYVGVSESNGDLTAVAASVDYGIKAYLGWDPEVSNYTEYLDGTGTQEIVLDCPPVPLEVQDVYLDPDRLFTSDTLLTADEDYVQRRNGTDGLGVLVRLNNVWPASQRASLGRLAATLAHRQGVIEVTYTTDNTAALAAATMAARMEGTALYLSYVNGGGMGLVTNDSMDGASIGITLRTRPGQRPNSRDSFASPMVASMLDPFAKIRTAR
jgi:hypothetical protein